jgi:CRP-like cAMP-binding protein
MVELEKPLWHLERFNVIKTLSKEEKMKLKSYVCMKEFNKGEAVHLPLRDTEQVYFLKRGNVKVSRISEEGREQILDVLGPGELFGNLTSEESSERDESAVALSDVLICYLNAHTFNSFMQENHTFSMSILKLVGLKLRKLEVRVEQLQFLNAKGRIKTVLRELADKHGKQLTGDYGVEIRLNLSHNDIGKLAGTVRQSVTSVMRELQDNKIIDYDHKKIVIREYAALKT